MTRPRRIAIPTTIAIATIAIIACVGNTQLSQSISLAATSQTETVPNLPLLMAQNRSLPDSTILVPPTRSGKGFLQVSNGTNRDAYVKLVDPNSRTLVASFYVKSSSNFRLDRIPDGTYQVLFMLGTNWNSETQSFTKNKRIAKFNKSLNFETTQQGNTIRYPGFQLTLNPVVGGNARASNVNEREFSGY